MENSVIENHIAYENEIKLLCYQRICNVEIGIVNCEDTHFQVYVVNTDKPVWVLGETVIEIDDGSEAYELYNKLKQGGIKMKKEIEDKLDKLEQKVKDYYQKEMEAIQNMDYSQIYNYTRKG